jgi:hypothetical protein
MGRDSAVGIATRYGLDGPGIEPRWGVRFFAPVQTGHRVYSACCTMGVGGAFVACSRVNFTLLYFTLLNYCCCILMHITLKN